MELIANEAVINGKCFTNIYRFGVSKDLDVVDFFIKGVLEKNIKHTKILIVLQEHNEWKETRTIPIWKYTGTVDRADNNKPVYEKLADIQVGVTFEPRGLSAPDLIITDYTDYTSRVMSDVVLPLAVLSTTTVFLLEYNKN